MLYCVVIIIRVKVLAFYAEIISYFYYWYFTNFWNQIHLLHRK